MASVGFRTVLAMALLVTLSGCSGGEAAVLLSRANEPCAVTVPEGAAPRGQPSFNHGGNGLWADLWWPQGTILAGPDENGAVAATIEPDGSIAAKLGWWRDAAGKLRIEGRRLDVDAAPLRATVPDGYGRTGFQAMGLDFPTEGCWRVTGRVGRADLTFVVLVAKRDSP
jgi:hypothetical protein